MLLLFFGGFEVLVGGGTRLEVVGVAVLGLAGWCCLGEGVDCVDVEEDVDDWVWLLVAKPIVWLSESGETYRGT